ncbi:MAG TPA: glycoside hydrolase family 3 C-terminal domain-containing protein [Baekduia sp.]|nr:glycoside hydrolase family 3 C-terminal domain-containing protein [Baekduia sp.]
MSTFFRLRLVALSIAALMVSALLAVAVANAAHADPTTWDNDPAVEAQVDQILGQMSNDEKAQLATGQLNNNYGFFTPAIPRLGIPTQTMSDGPVGVRIANPTIDQRSTQFPSATSMSASFDRDLVHLTGKTIGDEAFHTGQNFQLAPSVDVVRTQLWGRAFEGFGEDPLLNGLMGAQSILGMQSNPGLVATIKHWVVYNQETNRFTIDAVVNERTLREVYNRPFEIGVQQGHPGAAMCSFNKVNGTFSCENSLMNSLLKGDDGFRGFIMSDYNATPSTVQAANNGLDQEQPGDQGPGTANFDGKLVAAVAAGEVPQSRLDDMARRVLRAMVGLGLLTNPVQTDRFDEAAHREVARRVADEGSVLLKNRDDALPLRPDHHKLSSLAVIGPDADNTSAQGGGSSQISHPTAEVSPLDGIRDRAGSGSDVTYSPGTDGINEGDLLPGPAPVPSSVLTPAGGGSGGEHGLDAEYWGNTTFSGTPGLAEVDPNVSVNFGFLNFPGFNAASPKATQSKAVTGDFALLGDLSARWSGDLTAPATADYTLGLTARGDATLTFDGQPLVTHSGELSSVSKTVHLVAGVQHSVKIEYSAPAANTYQGGQIRFFWSHADDILSPAMQAAVDSAKSADEAVVVVRDYESEGYDRPNLELPRDQGQLIRAVAAANPNTTVVIETGSPVLTSTWEDGVPAILQAWYPGQEQGDSIAGILFGDVNPSGHLPVTIPRDESQVPPISPGPTADDDTGIFVGYKGLLKNGQTPSYAFGHGLSYSEFAYRDLRVNDGSRGRHGKPHHQRKHSHRKHHNNKGRKHHPQRHHKSKHKHRAHRAGHDHGKPPQGDVTLTFTVRNRSRTAGAAVAQAYLGPLPAPVETAARQLAGFERVSLEPGEARKVTITIPRRSLSYWDESTDQWVTPSGRVPVYVGNASDDTELVGVINVRS